MTHLELATPLGAAFTLHKLLIFLPFLRPALIRHPQHVRPRLDVSIVVAQHLVRLVV